LKNPNPRRRGQTERLLFPQAQTALYSQMLERDLLGLFERDKQFSRQGGSFHMPVLLQVLDSQLQVGNAARAFSDVAFRLFKVSFVDRHAESYTHEPRPGSASEPGRWLAKRQSFARDQYLSYLVAALVGLRVRFRFHCCGCFRPGARLAGGAVHGSGRKCLAFQL
jgi:hypothetical protein